MALSRNTVNVANLISLCNTLYRHFVFQKKSLFPSQSVLTQHFANRLTLFVKLLKGSAVIIIRQFSLQSQSFSNNMRLYTLHYISVNCSTCFGWYLHPSLGAHITVITASGTGQTVAATFRCRGAVGIAVGTGPR